MNNNHDSRIAHELGKFHDRMGLAAQTVPAEPLNPHRAYMDSPEYLRETNPIVAPTSTIKETK